MAEITSDYDERTRLVGYLTAAYSVFNNGMSMIMYAVWLVPTPEVSDGILNQAGYEEAGLIGAILIGLSMAGFAFGLHRYIARLREYRNEASLSPRDFLGQARDVFQDASLRALGVAGIIYYAASGTYAVLWVYIYSFFWAVPGVCGEYMREGEKNQDGASFPSLCVKRKFLSTCRGAWLKRLFTAD